MDKQLQAWVKALNGYEATFRRAVLDNEAELIDANTAQLEKGKDALGNFLDEYASDTYAHFKVAVKGSQAPLGVPNLRLEGDFYEGFVLRWDGGEAFITSTDYKTPKLVTMYGVNIFGVNFDENPDLRDRLLQSWLEHLKKDAA